MGNMMSNSRSDAGTSSINLDMDMLIKDFKTHLHSLEGAALSITASTNAQYELVQNFLSGKEAITQPTIEMDACSSTEVTSQSLNHHEKRVLAFIQDDICVQATVIKNIVTHLKALDGTSDQTLSQERQSSRTIEKETNESRMDLNYLRALAEDQKKTLEKTEKKIDELSQVKVAFKRSINTLQAEEQTDCLVEKEGIHRGSGNLIIFESNIKSNSNKKNKSGNYEQTRPDQWSSYDHESNNNKGRNKNRSKQDKGISDSSKSIKNVELKSRSEETVQKEREIKMMTLEMGKKDEELQRKKEEIIECGREIAALKTKNKEMEQSQSEEYSNLLNEMEDMQCKNDIELEALRNELKEKKNEISEMKIKIGKIDTLNAEINQMKRNCEAANKKKEEYFNERDDARRKTSDLEMKTRRLTNDIYKMKTEMGDLHKNIRILTREKEIALEKMRQRRKVSVMLYTPRRGDLLNTVVGELRTMLTQQFDAQQKADLTVLECENASQIEPNKPVLVVCINASRLGTDVTNAMQGIRGSSQVAVVILHHKEIHALPNQSSERVLTSQEYKSLGGIIDMAFLSSRGLYPCEMNKAAVTALMDFIRQKNIQ